MKVDKKVKTMKKILITLSIFICLFSLSVSSNLSITAQNSILETDATRITGVENPRFDNVVLITWDGVNAKYFDQMIENGSLVNVRRVLEGNGFKQKVRITSHRTSTDPGLSTIETGYGDEIHGIPYNMFGQGSAKLSIPEGYTISERLKATYGKNISTALFFPWALAPVNLTYINQEQMVDTIYDNMKPELDYYLASENLTWQPDDLDSRNATLHGFSEELGMYLSPVMRAEFLGIKAANWLKNITGQRFYLRIHLTEPDQAGHGYGVWDNNKEITPEYLQALLQCDEATGYVIDALEEAGIMNRTLFIVGTDHGFGSNGHTSGPWPGESTDITQMEYVFNNVSVRHPYNIPIAQMDIAPTVLTALGVDISTFTPAYLADAQTGTILWEREDTEAPIIKNSLFYRLDDSSFVKYDGETIVNGIVDFKVECKEWSDFKTVKLTIEETDYNPSFNGSLSVLWDDVDLTNIEKTQTNITITLTDIFGLSSTKTFLIKLNEETKTPISLVGFVAALLITGSVFYIKKRK
ncbi:MAG: alkaline phosphatase family protein [Candidatus Heimdallarchaeaceae archaeon]